MLEFKDRMKLARKRKLMTQTDLAKKTGMENSAISHFELGDRLPSFDSLKLLSDGLCVSADYLLGRTDDFAGGSVGIKITPEELNALRHLLDVIVCDVT